MAASGNQTEISWNKNYLTGGESITLANSLYQKKYEKIEFTKHIDNEDRANIFENENKNENEDEFKPQTNRNMNKY